jgi:hypothetical protein
MVGRCSRNESGCHFGLHLDALTEVGKITYKPAGIMAGNNDMKITVKENQHMVHILDSIDPIVFRLKLSQACKLLCLILH